MSPRLLDYLIDPNDGGALELHRFEGGDRPPHDEAREAVLVNPRSGRWYPVRDGIPSLFADALRQGDEREQDERFVAHHRAALLAVGCRLDALPRPAPPAGGAVQGDFARIEAERRARNEQAADYDRMLSLKIYERLETPAYRRALGPDDSASGAVQESRLPLLEAGCGTGRFTGLFASLGSEVIAVDLSRDSILRNRVRHAGKTGAAVHYLHADLTHLPLRDGAFGRTAHCGVYEHIPSRALRQQFLAHARRTLAPDGRFLLSAYRYGGLTRLFAKEGEHAGGIPFTRFTEAELRQEVEPYFEICQFRANLGVYMSMLVARPKVA